MAHLPEEEIQRVALKFFVSTFQDLGIQRDVELNHFLPSIPIAADAPNGTPDNPFLGPILPAFGVQVDVVEQTLQRIQVLQMVSEFRDLNGHQLVAPRIRFFSRDERHQHCPRRRPLAHPDSNAPGKRGRSKPVL